MKQLLTTVFILILFACNNDTTKPNLSGQILNFNEDVVVLSGLNFKDSIAVINGIFDKYIELPYTGLYSLYFDEFNHQELYLESGTTLKLDVDFEDFDSMLMFSGDVAEENKFWLKKRQLIEDTYGVYGDVARMQQRYTLDEADFIAFNEQYTSQILAALDEASINNSAFVELETKDAQFVTIREYLLYPRFKRYFEGVIDVEISDEFLTVPDDLDLENDSYYYFSEPYRAIVNLQFDETLYSDYDESDNMLNKIFEGLDEINSPLIRSELVSGMLYYLSGSDNLEKDYNKMLSYSLDPTFKNTLTEKYNAIKNIVKGKVSPTFSYENIDGSITSLEDLKGTYVYIDVWATWCGPCIAEIPFLKELEEDYHHKPVSFVSLSIDKYKDKDKWAKMIIDKQLGGIQIIADKDWSSDFVKQYAIDGIPRFILIDTEGKIISSDAPRPSNPQIRAMFDELM